MPNRLLNPLRKFKRRNDRQSLSSFPQSEPMLNSSLFEVEAGRRHGREWEAEKIQGAERAQYEEERRRLAEERERRVAEEEQRRIAEREQRRIVEEEHRRIVEEQKRVAEEQRRVAEEVRRRAQERKQKASAQSIRYLRNLIREKYDVDLYIWSKRNVLKANQKIILEKCKRADSILQNIYDIVDSWERNQFNDEEWKMAKKIKDSLMERAQ